MNGKIALIFILAGLSPWLSHAQFQVGPTIGVNVATVQYSKEAREDIRDGGAKIQPLLKLQIGVTGEYALSDLLFLQSGLLFNGAGVKYSYNFDDFGVDVKGSTRTSITYLDIPLTARYQLAEFDGFSLSGWGGLIIGVALSGKITTVARVNGERESDSESLDFGSSRSDDLKGSDLRLALGAIAESEDYPVQLKVSLQQGLSDIYPDRFTTYSWRNFLLSFSATYFLELD